MKRRLFLVAAVGLCCVIMASCVTNSTAPPPEFPLHGTSIYINGGAEFSGSTTVHLVIDGAEADSIFVQNIAPVPMDGKWFKAPGNWLEVPDWDLGEGEGTRTVRAKFKSPGWGTSDPIHAEISVDLTPPHVAPTIVFPARGAESFPAIAGMRWTAAEDEMADDEDIRYEVFLGPDSLSLDSVWEGSATGAFLGELEPDTDWYWKVVASDPAGNTTSISGDFHTWDEDLPEFMPIPSGTFMMGSPVDEPGRFSWENLHEVTISHPFYMGATEVVYSQFLRQLEWARENGFVTVDETGVFDMVESTQDTILDFTSWGAYEYQPDGRVTTTVSQARIAQSITWYGAAAFCDWLNLQAGFEPLYDRINDWRCNEGRVSEAIGFRLATEAEWEYACRAGTSTAFYNGEITNTECEDWGLLDVAWYCGNYGFYDFLPGLLAPNAWGLYDMHGGISDWCYDRFVDDLTGPVTDPVVDLEGKFRIARGSMSSFPGYSRDCRSAARSYGDENNVINDHAIRVVLSYGEFMSVSPVE